MQRAFAAPVAQLCRHLGIAFTGEDRFDDGLGACAVDVTENVLHFEVHLSKHFLHEVQLHGCMLQHLAAVAHEVAQWRDRQRGAEGFAQQPGGVHLL